MKLQWYFDAQSTKDNNDAPFAINTQPQKSDLPSLW